MVIDVSLGHSRAATLPPESLSRLLWDGVAVQYVLTNGGAQAVGLLQIHQLDLQSLFAHMSILVAPAPESSEDPLPATANQFIDQVFRDFPLRKIYVEVLDHEVAGTVARLGRPIIEEARLREHERRALEEYSDLVYFSISK